jgi:hypothetical protein
MSIHLGRSNVKRFSMGWDFEGSEGRGVLYICITDFPFVRE